MAYSHSCPCSYAMQKRNICMSYMYHWRFRFHFLEFQLGNGNWCTGRYSPGPYLYELCREHADLIEGGIENGDVSSTSTGISRKVLSTVNCHIWILPTHSLLSRNTWERHNFNSSFAGLHRLFQWRLVRRMCIIRFSLLFEIHLYTLFVYYRQYSCISGALSWTLN